jgi:hypothetical protein
MPNVAGSHFVVEDAGCPTALYTGQQREKQTMVEHCERSPMGILHVPVSVFPVPNSSDFMLMVIQLRCRNLHMHIPLLLRHRESTSPS